MLESGGDSRQVEWINAKKSLITRGGEITAEVGAHGRSSGRRRPVGWGSEPPEWGSGASTGVGTVAAGRGTPRNAAKPRGLVARQRVNGVQH